jgi:hypothetical protein
MRFNTNAIPASATALETMSERFALSLGGSRANLEILA